MDSISNTNFSYLTMLTDGFEDLGIHSSLSIITTDQSSLTCTEVFECSTETFEYTGYVFVHTPIATFGVLFNLVNILIFLIGRKAFHDCGTWYVFIFAVSFTDFLCMIVVLPYGLLVCMSDNTHVIHIYIIYIFVPMTNAFSTANIWISFAMGIDRYKTFKIPKWQSKFTIANAKWIIIILSIFAAFLNTPYFFIANVDTNGHIVMTDFGNSRGYITFSTFRAVFGTYLPMLLVVIINFVLCYIIGARKYFACVAYVMHHKNKVQPEVSSQCNCSLKPQPTKIFTITSSSNLIQNVKDTDMFKLKDSVSLNASVISHTNDNTNFGHYEGSTKLVCLETPSLNLESTSDPSFKWNGDEIEDVLSKCVVIPSKEAKKEYQPSTVPPKVIDAWASRSEEQKLENGETIRTSHITFLTIVSVISTIMVFCHVLLCNTIVRKTLSDIDQCRL